MSQQDFSEVEASGSGPVTTFRESAIRKLFGSSSILLSPELKCDRPHVRGSLIIQNKASSHYEAGMEAVLRLQFERAVTCFSKAITLRPEQTQLYVERAEVYLQLCDFKSASLDYKHACYLEPQTEAYFHRLAFIYYMQGQCLCDQGMFMEALEYFAKAAELKPNYKPYQTRSLACLTALGRYSDCLRLVTNLLDADTPSADLFTLRARLHHQLNQDVQCYYDLKAALRLDPSAAEALSLLGELEEAAEHFHQQAVTKAVEGELSSAVVKISTALEKNPEKAQYYLFRGTLYRRLKDFIAAVEDLALAADFRDAGAKCPEGQNYKGLEDDAQVQLVLTYNDFAVHCYSHGFHSEAAMLLTRAIQEQRNESRLFINRGDCFLKQEEWHFALADYQQAEELDPQNLCIWRRLAMIHSILGLQSLDKLMFREAADKFSVAIKYNPGVAQYYGNRAKAYIRMNNLEEAKQDAFSALILEPTSDELVALLLKLFPGCSLSDVMSSSTVKTVKAQLMERTQTWKLTGSTASRLSDKLERMILEDDADNKSEANSQSSRNMNNVEMRHKSCVSPKGQLQSKEQVIQAVKKVLHERQSLYHTGPRLAPLRPANTLESDICGHKSSCFQQLGEQLRARDSEGKSEREDCDAV